MRVNSKGKVIGLTILGVVLFIILALGVYFVTFNALSKLDIDGNRFSSYEEVESYIEKVKDDTCKLSVVSSGNKLGDIELKMSDYCKFRDSKDIVGEIDKYIKDNRLKLVLSSGVKYECKMFDVDTDKINSEADKIVNEYSKDKVSNTYKIKNGKLVIKTGQDGVAVSKDNAVDTIRGAIESRGKSEYIIIASKDEFMETPEKISADNSKSPINAGIKDENGIKTIVYAEDGYRVSAKKVSEALKDYKENTEYTVDIEVVKPDISSVDTGELFKDILGEYSTSGFGGSGRAENIRLAASFINEKVLNPGEVFSYCDNVGRTTAERGFKMATVYSNGKAVPGMGGGICQVSSTLYNAVLRANLELVQRVNHSLPVHYVPWGMDATVSSGNPDFKFKNNKNSPVKIVTSCAGGKLNIKIMGISTGETVELWSEKASTNGSYVTYKTYKKVTKDGSVIYNGYLNSSTYKVK